MYFLGKIRDKIVVCSIMELLRYTKDKILCLSGNFVKEQSNTEIERYTRLEIIIISIFRQNQRQFLQFVEPNLHQYWRHQIHHSWWHFQMLLLVSKRVQTLARKSRIEISGCLYNLLGCPWNWHFSCYSFGSGWLTIFQLFINYVYHYFYNILTSVLQLSRH